jgi:hypothetical protein
MQIPNDSGLAGPRGNGVWVHIESQDAWKGPLGEGEIGWEGIPYYSNHFTALQQMAAGWSNSFRW